MLTKPVLLLGVYFHNAWWRHQTETFSALLAILEIYPNVWNPENEWVGEWTDQQTLQNANYVCNAQEVFNVETDKSLSLTPTFWWGVGPSSIFHAGRTDCPVKGFTTETAKIRQGSRMGTILFVITQR